MKKLLFALLVSTTTFAQSITPQEVLEKYFSAIGGRENMDKVKSLYAVSTTSVMGQEIEAVENKKAPNKYSSVVDQNGVEMAKVIFDGSKAIVSQMGQSQTIEGDAAKTLLTQALIFPELMYTEEGVTLESSANEKAGDEDCYVIHVKGIPGLNSIKEFYSVSSGFKIKQEIENQTGFVSIQYKDYKDQGSGIKMANTLLQEAMGMTIEKQYTTLQINAEIPDSAFEIK